MSIRKRGKPLTLTAERIQDVAAHLRIGGSRRGAAAAIGVDERTVRRWNKKGKEGGGELHGELWNAVVAAEAEYRAPKPKPHPPVTKRIIEATIREQKDGRSIRSEVELTSDQYDALCAACSDSKYFVGRNNGWAYSPRPGDHLTAQQQGWIDHMLHVTLCDSLGRKAKTEFRPAE
jgi:hypothetical protein